MATTNGTTLADPKATLAKLNQNLNVLQEREAKYGGNAPLDLLTQIEDHETAIELVQAAIAGELTEEELDDKEKIFRIRNRSEIMKPLLGSKIVVINPGKKPVSESPAEGIDILHAGFDRERFQTIVEKLAFKKED